MYKEPGARELKKARRNYNTFNMLNSFSFTILNSYILSLYALSLGAGTTFIGFLNAVQFSSFFFMPLGKTLIRKRSIVRVFGWAWVFRYAGMLPCVLAPIAALAGSGWLALALIFAGNIFFNVIRGIGMIGNNPVLGLVSKGNDQGRYINQLSVINSITSTVTSLLAALALGNDATPTRYAIFMAVGILMGIIGSLYLFKIPEPALNTDDKSRGFLTAVKDALKDGPFRRFITAFLIASFAAGMSRPFQIVFFKEVYGKSDALIIVFSVVGSLGTVAIGLFSRMVTDRTGAKPLIIFSLIAALVAMLPMAIAPTISSAVLLLLFLFALAFLLNFGFSGLDSSAQTYFFSLTDSGKMLDYAIIYFYALGASGALGSAAGGTLLDALELFNLERIEAYRVYYGAMCLLTVVAILLCIRIKQLGSYSVRAAFSAFFSLRDIRAFTLLERLEKSSSIDEDRKLLHRLEEAHSTVSEPDILEHLKSPSMIVRADALRALEVQSRISPVAQRLLMQELNEKMFTTAYIAARILGTHQAHNAIPLLRQHAGSTDYVLAGECLLALGRMNDQDSIPLIETIMMETANPRVMIMGATALRYLRSKESIPLLLRLLGGNPQPGEELQNELLITLACLYDVEKTFYPLYYTWLKNPDRAVWLLSELSISDTSDEALEQLFPENEEEASAKALLQLIPPDENIQRAIEDPKVLKLSRFRFFLAVLQLKSSKH